MGKRIYRLAAAAVTAAIGTVTGAGVASAGAEGEQVQTRLADVSQVSLSSLAESDDSVLANSIRQVSQETSGNSGPLSGFQSAPPPR